MSAPKIMQVREACKADPKLNAVDKLILWEWAWNTPEHVAPRPIRFKTYARNLGLSVNGVKKAVLHLIALGYLTPIAVQVVDGPKLSRGSPSDPLPKTQGDHPVTPGGSPSDPQRDHPVTPIKRKKIKSAAASASASKGAKPSAAKDRRSAPPAAAAAVAPPSAVVAVDPATLTRFQRAQVLADRSVAVAGVLIEPGSPQMETLRLSLRGICLEGAQA